VPCVVEQADMSLVRYEVFMALYVEIMDFWDVMPCIFMDRYECFRGACLTILCGVTSQNRIFNLKTYLYLETPTGYCERFSTFLCEIQ
jgi:hypothetical protein